MILFLFVNIVETASDEVVNNIPSSFKDALPLVVGAITTVVTLIITRYFAKREKDSEGQISSHKMDLDQMVKQREFIIKENEELWLALRAELDACRQEREKLDVILETLRKRVSRVELELEAWELGLKTPQGFRLVKLKEKDDQ